MLIHPSILYQALGIISAKKNVELLREFYKKILPARFYAVVTVFWDMFDFFLYKSEENFSWTILEGIAARTCGEIFEGMDEIILESISGEFLE